MIVYEDIAPYCTQDRAPFFELAARYARPNGRHLDLGAGAAVFADILGDENIYLVDGNPENVEHLKSRYKNTFLLNLPNSLPFEKEFFDLVHTSHLVEHLQPQELYDFLTECDRVIAPGGHLVISAPLMWEGFYDDLSHVKPYNPRVFQKYLSGPYDYDVLTRPSISRQYVTTELVYRYRATALPPAVQSNSRLVRRVTRRVLDALNFRETSYYTKTGFTLVLTKMVATK